jgi:hypothetical protein
MSRKHETGYDLIGDIHGYWLPPESPRPLTENVACLDYSVAKNGMLVAYRWDGERTLNLEKMVFARERE